MRLWDIEGWWILLVIIFFELGRAKCAGTSWRARRATYPRRLGGHFMKGSEAEWARDDLKALALYRVDRKANTK